jgi:hypothetical protein
MMVAVRVAARKDYRSYIDVSKFTGMEIEHGHDTGSVMDHTTELHTHPASLKDFERTVDAKIGDIKSKALQ